MDLGKSKIVQNIAKSALEDLTLFIRPDVSERQIAEQAERLLRQKGVDQFWYHGVAALVLVGARTTLSVSGKAYEPADLRVAAGDLVTVDVSPMMGPHWGDCARSYVVTAGQTFLDEPGSEDQMRAGIEAEHYLHKALLAEAAPKMSFEDVYFSMNDRIRKLGFKNLDFLGNLGHSIEMELDHRRYLEKGERTKLGEVTCFTFEPHIQSETGGPGFKRENIYYFTNGRLQEL